MAAAGLGEPWVLAAGEPVALAAGEPVGLAAGDASCARARGQDEAWEGDGQRREM